MLIRLMIRLLGECPFEWNIEPLGSISHGVSYLGFLFIFSVEGLGVKVIPAPVNRLLASRPIVRRDR